MINKGQAAWFGLAWLPVVCEKLILVLVYFTSCTLMPFERRRLISPIAVSCDTSFRLYFVLPRLNHNNFLFAGHADEGV